MKKLEVKIAWTWTTRYQHYTQGMRKRVGYKLSLMKWTLFSYIQYLSHVSTYKKCNLNLKCRQETQREIQTRCECSNQIIINEIHTKGQNWTLLAPILNHTKFHVGYSRTTFYNKKKKLKTFFISTLVLVIQYCIN